jgi:hypothetical protein
MVNSSPAARFACSDQDTGSLQNKRIVTHPPEHRSIPQPYLTNRKTGFFVAASFVIVGSRASIAVINSAAPKTNER